MNGSAGAEGGYIDDEENKKKEIEDADGDVEQDANGEPIKNIAEEETKIKKAR